MEGGKRMNPYRGMRFMVLSAVLSSWLFGCAMEKSATFRTAPEHYQTIIEQQKAGISPDQNFLRKLPDMTAEELEGLGDTYIKQNNLAMAIAQYNQALKMDPARVVTRYKYGVLLLKTGLPKEALGQFQTILEHDEKFARGYEGIGQALLQVGDDLGADQEFRRALSFDPDLWTAHNYLGILADRRHLHLSAIKAYQTALAIKPREPRVLNNLGMAYYMNGQYAEAVRSLHLALQAGAISPKVANNLGLALSKMKQFSQAFDAFKRGTDLAKAYNNVGIGLLEARRPQRAISCFEKAIEIQPRFYEKASENLTYARRALAKQAKQGKNMESKLVACL